MGEGHDQLDEHLHCLGQELCTSVHAGGSAFCGVNVQEYAINGVTYAWRRGSNLKIALDFDDLGQLRASQVREIVEAQINQIRAVTDGLSFELFTPTLSANLVCKLARLDGRNGVLADCQIPPPNANPANTQLVMRIDTGENWRYFTSERINGAIDFGRTWLHEFLHGIGLGHQPASIQRPAIIQPQYNPLLWLLQDADKGEITRRYGGRTTPIAPTPPVVPAPAGGIQGEIKVVLNGETWTASGPLRKVATQAIYVDRYPTGPVIPPPIVYTPEDFELPDTDLEGELS
jgi:hypothetical protein